MIDETAKLLMEFHMERRGFIIMAILWQIQRKIYKLKKVSNKCYYESKLQESIW